MNLIRPHRRALLGGLSATLAAPSIIRAQTVSDTPFTLGVASGDPSPDGFVLWTRLAPKPLELHSGMAMTKATVAWEVATDQAFARPCNSLNRPGKSRACPRIAMPCPRRPAFSRAPSHLRNAAPASCGSTATISRIYLCLLSRPAPPSLETACWFAWSAAPRGVARPVDGASARRRG